MIDATDPIPALTEAPAPSRVSRVWRIVIIVVSFQVLAIVAAGMVFSALGAIDGTGGCGGG